MVVEERTYVLHTGVSMADYLRIYETEGLPAQKPILGGFLGYFVTEFGTQNQLVHLWAYADLEDRRARRAELAKNAQWQGCLAKIRPMILSMENRILYPTSFSPIRSLPVQTGQADTALA
ncbi:NIPSNAP family protein [Azospirillum doebereinerae]